MAAPGFSGELVDQSVEAHGAPIQQAYQTMNKILDKPPYEETAAVGAMLAILDHGLIRGRDLAICADGEEGMAAILTPRLTAPGAKHAALRRKKYHP